jgi:hypothetical protein
MENLTQEFSDLTELGKDSWECHLGVYSLKTKRKSLNPQVLSTRDQGWFVLYLYVTV